MKADRKVPFVEHLERLRDGEDRAALAALRRGLGKDPGMATEMHRYVVPWLPAESPRWAEEPYYIVASLFASHPKAGGQGTMGDALALVAKDSGSASVERHFVTLLKSRSEEVAYRLRHVVALARSHEVPICWHRLFKDIRDWQHPSRYVQRAWARAFWTTVADHEATTEDTAQAAGEGQ
jgi:CRISPR system Cascade subunit CasB